VQQLPLPPVPDNRLYRVAAQRLRGMAKSDGTQLRGKLLAVSQEIDQFADKLEGGALV
jgi:hypothetical protein